MEEADSCDAILGNARKVNILTEKKVSFQVP